MVQVKGMQAAVSLMHGGFNGPNRAAEEALDMAPDFLAADAGSTDAGPAFLGGERGMTHRGGIKASMEYILPQAVGRGIPFIIGSAGLGGNRTTVGQFREIIEEVAREKGLSFRLAVINSEQDKDYLRERLRAGKIKPLAPSEPLTEDAIDRATHVVGMMGTEPVEEAIRQRRRRGAVRSHQRLGHVRGGANHARRAPGAGVAHGQGDRPLRHQHRADKGREHPRHRHRVRRPLHHQGHRPERQGERPQGRARDHLREQQPQLPARAARYAGHLRLAVRAGGSRAPSRSPAAGSWSGPTPSSWRAPS